MGASGFFYWGKLMALYPLTNKCNLYARQVISGKVPACIHIVNACQRHLTDLKNQLKPSCPYKFDKAKSESILNFAELMPHTKGKWKGSLIVLEPWQCFLLGVPFGWVRKKDGFRRFREIYAEIPRKNSKSTCGAIIGNYMFSADGELSSEVFSAATTEQQAYEVFRPAWNMTAALPKYQQAFDISLGGTVKNPGNIYSMSTGSRFETVVGKPGDGASPHCYVLDEYHESKTDESFDTGKTGMGARQQPMMVVITTAGTNTSNPCFEKRKQVEKILSGLIVNDDIFGMIYTIDKDDPWTDLNSWKKANPNYGISVFEDYLKSELKTAIQNPRKQNIMKCKHLNMWSSSGSAWINSINWENCRDTEMNLNDFNESPCYVGLDLASKKDIASKMRLFVKTPDGETKTHYYLFSTHYTPSENIEGEDKAHYAGWAHMGHIKTHAGARIDIEEIQEEIKLDAKRFDITGEENAGGDVASDPWNAQQLGTNLLNEGISYVEIPQTAASLSEPMKELEVLIMEGRLHHDGNEVTTWMFQNVFCEPDMKDNIFPRKESKNSNNKIDGAVATINAMARAMYDTGESVSVYEDRGILTF